MWAASSFIYSPDSWQHQDTLHVCGHEIMLENSCWGRKGNNIYAQKQTSGWRLTWGWWPWAMMAAISELKIQRSRNKQLMSQWPRLCFKKMCVNWNKQHHLNSMHETCSEGQDTLTRSCRSSRHSSVTPWILLLITLLLFLLCSTRAEGRTGERNSVTHWAASHIWGSTIQDFDFLVTSSSWRPALRAQTVTLFKCFIKGSNGRRELERGGVELLFGDERRSKFAQFVRLNQEKSNMTETRRHQICADEILMLPKCLLKPHTHRGLL